MDFEVKTEGVLAESPEVQQKNGLLYELPQSLSSSVKKTYVEQQSQRTEYVPGQTMVFDMNVGSSFIDPENSYLTFDIASGDAAATSSNYVPLKPRVGAIGLIKEIHIHAKSGVELDRIQDVNQYSICRSRLKNNSDYFVWSKQWGATNNADVTAGVPYLGRIGNVAKKVSIPMKEISGLFCPTVKGMKMPNGLISGARIEITLESYARAFGTEQGTMNSTDTYTISDPVITCLYHTLTDNSMRVLNEESTENGLEYTYTRVFTTSEPTSQTASNIQIKKAVAQGVRALSCCIATDKLADSAENSFDGDYAYTSAQWRIGSMFYPQQRMDNLTDIYQHSMNTYNKQPSSDWWGFNYDIDNYYDSTRNMIIGSSFETDQRLNLSGIPINNSATLTLECTTEAGGSRTIFVFLEYVAVATSYLTNVDVKI